MDYNDQNAINLTKAIGLQEGGGKFLYNDTTGDAGTSKGAYQWQPGNFESMAKEYGLDPTDFSPKNQNAVAYKRVKERLDAGYKPWEVAAEWNSGNKDNWKDHSGDTIINGKTIHYDTPAYVQGVKNYYQKLTNGTSDVSQGTETPKTNEPDTSITNGALGANPNDDLTGKLLNNSITRGIQALFPGKEVGESIGTLAGYALTAIKEKLGLAPKGATENYDLSAPTPLQVGGDIAQGALMVGGIPGAAGMETGLGKAAVAGLESAAYGGANAVASGSTDVNEIGKESAIMGGVGLATGGLGALAGKLIPHDVPFATKPEEFKATYDKAFTPLKSDIKVGDERYSSANDLMNYIVDNKDKVGANILDKNGEVKLPSKYNMEDNLNALKNAQPEIYKEYTQSLTGGDLTQYRINLTNKVNGLVSDLESKLNSTISSTNQSTIKNIVEELKSPQMGNSTPETLYGYIKDLGRRAFTGNMNESKSILADVGAKLTSILDDSMEASDSVAFAKGKQLYRATKLAENNWTKAALKQIKNTPGLYQKLTNLGMTAEGIQFLITHDPHSLAIAAGLKGASAISKWLNSSEGAMQTLYKTIEKSKGIK